MALIYLNDIRLNAEISGPADGAGLVLIHALGTRLELWDELVALLPKSLRILRSDQRGHGASDVPTPPYAMATPFASLAGLGGPALQGMMSRATPEVQQGELAGINTSPGAMSMILAPMVMTSIFAFFTSATAPIYLPGAPFLVSAMMRVAAVPIFVAGTREASAA